MGGIELEFKSLCEGQALPKVNRRTSEGNVTLTSRNVGYRNRRTPYTGKLRPPYGRFFFASPLWASNGHWWTCSSVRLLPHSGGDAGGAGRPDHEPHLPKEEAHRPHNGPVVHQP